MRIKLSKSLCDERWILWNIFTDWGAGCSIYAAVGAAPVVGGIVERLQLSRAGRVCEEWVKFVPINKPMSIVILLIKGDFHLQERQLPMSQQFYR